MKSEAERIVEQYIINEPFICELKVTDKCNLGCLYCYRKNNSDRSIDPELVSSFFDELAKIHNGKMVCSFHGGEPLVRFDIVKQIVEECERSNYKDRIQYTIQTNATLIDNEMIDFFINHRIGVGVSYDGDEGVGLRVNNRGDTVANRIKEQIKLLVSRKIPVSITCVVTDANVFYLCDLVKWCYENRITAIGLNAVRMEAKKGHDGINLNVDDYKKVGKELLELIITLNSISEDHTIFISEVCNMVYKVVDSNNNYHVCNYPCRAGKNIICLNTDGRIDRCDCIGELDINTVGYYEKGNLRELIVKAREGIEFKRESNIECCKCELKRYCIYGCPAESIISYGEEKINERGVLCEWYKEMIKAIIKLLQSGVNPNLLAPYADRL